jgi:DNA polymerase-3 subunit delta
VRFYQLHNDLCNMSAEKILEDWKNKKFKSIYWLEGEESYFIDTLVNYAEKNILTAAEADFNLSIFYGKDADWADVLNACKRHPMFGNKQVVLLKEAQQMRDIEKLESYIDHPLPTTVFVVSRKEKKVDGRKGLGKKLKDSKLVEVLSTKKLYDNQLPEWTEQMIKGHGLSIAPKALHMLIDHIGNDLSRIENEVEKLMLNLAGKKSIAEEEVERFIGVSKEFNAFELQAAIAQRDLSKSIRIIQYFESNPKAGPIQLVLPSVYNFFSKLYVLKSLPNTSDSAAASALGVSPYFMKEYNAAARKYDFAGVEKVLLLLHQYNLRTLGIHNGSANDAALMKELVVKIMQ